MIDLNIVSLDLSHNINAINKIIGNINQNTRPNKVLIRILCNGLDIDLKMVLDQVKLDDYIENRQINHEMLVCELSNHMTTNPNFSKLTRQVLVSHMHTILIELFGKFIKHLKDRVNKDIYMCIMHKKDFLNSVPKLVCDNDFDYYTFHKFMITYLAIEKDGEIIKSP
ncbi:7291_t:CDS:1, partial [Cetraspora pellucida]